MVEANLPTTSPETFSPLSSPVDYEFYCDEVFQQWEAVQNPEQIHTDATHLLFLALQYPEFGPLDRLQEYVFVTERTMIELWKFVQRSDCLPNVAKQAEMIHAAWGQVYAQSMVELAKLANPIPPTE